MGNLKSRKNAINKRLKTPIFCVSKMVTLKNTFFHCLIITLLLACQDRNSLLSPVEFITKEMSDKKAYSIILFDMSVEGNFTNSYFHQYRIVFTQANNKTEERITEWMETTEAFFQQHIDNMGMELVAKNPLGEVNTIPSPPGFWSYVGNPKFGRWREKNGHTFWEFHEQFAFFTAMFHLKSSPVYQSVYQEYSKNYRGQRIYYGESQEEDASLYGTLSSYSTQNRPHSVWSRNPYSKPFSTRVNNALSRNKMRKSEYSRPKGTGFKR